MLALLLATASAHVPVVTITNPGEDWCGIINGTIGNDLVMLEPGTYQGPCAIVAEVSDVDYELTTVQAFDPVDLPVLVPGAADHVLSVAGHRLILHQLRFADLPEGVDAVRVDGIRELVIARVRFQGFAGAGVRTRGPVLERFVVRDNEFTDVGVAAEIGCPDGSCGVGAFETEDNLLVRAGLGFLVAPGAPGTMQDDVVIDAVTAVRLAGGQRVAISGGLYTGTGPVLDVLDGPALIESTVVIGSSVAVGAAGADVRDVALVGDTIIGGEGTALDVTGWGPGRGLRVASTALDEALPAIDGVDWTASIGCEDPATCFTDAASWDLYPAPGSPLRDAGVSDPEVLADWCGRPRLDPPCVGAFEAYPDLTMAPLEPIDKELFDCSFLEGGTTTTPPTDGTDGTTDTGGATTPPPPGGGGGGRGGGGCGCASGAPGSPWLGVLLLLATRQGGPKRVITDGSNGAG